MGRVSVVIPCFDAGVYLEEALASAEGQTHRPFEIVIVDDGSTDPDTLALLSRLSSRARLLRVPHGGVCAARNHGLAAATGDYVCFLDADDRLRPTCLERCGARLDADPELAFVSFWVELFGDESWQWRPERCDLLALLDDCCVATAAVVRRASLSAIGGFDAEFELGHEDWDLWLSLVAGGARGEILPEVLFDYRRRAGSRSSTADGDAVFLEMLRQRFRKHEAAHRAHLVDLVAHKDEDARLHLERITATDDKVRWDVERRRAEVDRLRRTLASVPEVARRRWWNRP